jgi:Putative beta-barrel porin-2, OmpL-like. bbp2
MKKILLASAVSALFAAPATALAAGGPAAPTLDRVLEASGINVSGYIDAGYTHADRNLEAGGFSDRVFDSQNNSFGLNQFGLSVAKQPRQGFGGLVNLTGGRDAQVINSVGAAPSQIDITQAYAQYATGPLTVIGGKFATLHGTEVIWSPSNNNISRSILFGAEPFTHTGVRGTWVLNNQVSLIGGINNGWDQLTDPNKGKTVELGATLNPIKPLNLSVSGMSGKEPTGAGDGVRNSVNVVGSYAIMDPLSVGAEALLVQQENFPSGAGTIKAKYTGVALYGSYMFTSKLRGALRLEPQFDDKDGLRFGNANTKYREVTATGAYLPGDNFEARAELRRDQATNPVFVNTNGSTSKSLMTVAVQALYKF